MTPRPANPSPSDAPISGFPVALQRLLARTEIYPGLEAVDFREMAKFGEATNIWGLPLHPLRRPPDPDGLLESEGGIDDLPAELLGALRRELATQPHLLVRGRLAGSMAQALEVSAIFPRSAAQLAQAWDALLWRGPEGADDSPPGLTILQLPEFPEPALLSLPEEGVALILGTDDPRPGLVVALEWVNRRWRAREELMKLKRLPATEQPLKLLAGGSFLFGGGAAAGADRWSLVYPGDSVPISWERTLLELLPELKGCTEADLLVAGAEPWCGQGRGLAGPFCRHPLLPAALLRDSERWRKAALDPDALPFGLTLTPGGDVDWGATPEDAFVVIPRHAVPAPFPAEAGPLRPAAHFTHRSAKPEAMELWAMGFPSPEVLGPGGRT